MNTVNNRRKKESQERIEKIFLELVQSKEISEITVTDICEKAKLNRTTFYSNYLDIYDLADKIKQKLETDVLNLYDGKTFKMQQSGDLLKLFNHIKDNQLFYKTYFKLGFDKNNFINNYDKAFASLYYQNDDIDYHITFFKAGLNAIILKWLYNGCQKSAQEMYKIIQDEYKKDLL